jgi:hypothetical protein
MVKGIDLDCDHIAEIRIMHSYMKVVERNTSAGIHNSLNAHAEDVSGGLKGRLNRRMSERATFSLTRHSETDKENLLGRGVDLLTVIPIRFITEYLSCCMDICNIFQYIGSNHSILQPAVGVFNLPLCPER